LMHPAINKIFRSISVSSFFHGSISMIRVFSFIHFASKLLHTHHAAVFWMCRERALAVRERRIYPCSRLAVSQAPSHGHLLFYAMRCPKRCYRFSLVVPSHLATRFSNPLPAALPCSNKIGVELQASLFPLQNPRASVSNSIVVVTHIYISNISRNFQIRSTTF
jgi:hypothetical protein